MATKISNLTTMALAGVGSIELTVTDDGDVVLQVRLDGGQLAALDTDDGVTVRLERRRGAGIALARSVSSAQGRDRDRKRTARAPKPASPPPQEAKPDGNVADLTGALKASIEKGKKDKPEETTVEPETQAPAAAVDEKALRRALDLTFGIRELRTLCTEAGVKQGRTKKQSIDGLVAYAKQHGAPESWRTAIDAKAS